MKPLNTFYRLYQPSDHGACKKIWEDNQKIFGKPQRLGWPTVVAERDGKILGFLSSHPTAKIIVARPLIVNGGSGIMTVVRLVEAYENILRVAGVSSYVFHVEKKNKNMINMIKKRGMKEYEKDKTGLWFRREINRGLDEQESEIS